MRGKGHLTGGGNKESGVRIPDMQKGCEAMTSRQPTATALHPACSDLHVPLSAHSWALLSLCDLTLFSL